MASPYPNGVLFGVGGANAITIRPLVFMHVMKCGGTSVRSALRSAFPADDVAFGLDGGAAMDAVGGILNQQENWRFRSELLAYLMAGPRPSLIYGHFRYSDRHAELLAGADLITILRPPEERVISLHRYRKFSGRDGVPATAGLAETLRQPEWQSAGHHYVETFCGDPALDPRSDAAISAALANLERFAVVGLLSDLDAFARDVSKLCGTDIAIPRLNSSPAPNDYVDSTPGLADTLASVCAPDRTLFAEFAPT